MENLIERYKDLIIRRDELKSEAEQHDQMYIREFGQIHIDIFETSVECIKLKKSIEYCQKCLNKGKAIDVDKIKEIIQMVADINLGKITQMKERQKFVMSGKSISEYELKEIKMRYRKFAKIFHPDVNPICAEESELIELWHRIYNAYMRNDLKALRECEVIAADLAKKYNLAEIEVDYGDIEDKISELEVEIQKIVSTEPYTYIRVFACEETLEERRNELEQMLAQYKEYLAQLRKTYDEIFEQTGGTFVWTMN